MLTGQITRHGEPVVFVHLILRKRPVKVPAVIDTGFNGYLSVPRRLADRGGWQSLGEEEFEIATGQLVKQPVYVGQVIFDRTRVMVYAVGTEAKDVLIGTRLLEKKILTIDFHTKRVKIR